MRTRLASQLRVKLGMMRPATTEISTITAARPRRHPRPGGAAMPAASSCIKQIGGRENGHRARPSAGCASSARRRSRARSRPTKATGKARSAAMASQTGISAETRPAIRPSSHKPAKLASGSPLTGSRPVQFGIAVNRKPAIAAIAKPNSISWMCQVKRIEPAGQRAAACEDGDPQRERSRRPEAAARKNGRNPRVRKAGTERPAERSAAMLMPHHPRGAPRRAGPERTRSTKRGKSGRSFTMKSQAISNAPSAKTTSPGIRIHCQNSVVS